MGDPPPSSGLLPNSFEWFKELVSAVDTLFALGLRLGVIELEDCKEYLLLEARIAFLKTIFMSLQGFLRFVPSSKFYAKEGGYTHDLSSASVMARQTIEDAISFFYLSQPALTNEEKAFRQLVWQYHGERELLVLAKFKAREDPTLSISVKRDVEAARKAFENSVKEQAFSAMWNALRQTAGLQKKILTGVQNHVLSKPEILELRGIRIDTFNLYYKILSNFTHPSSFSYLLIRHSNPSQPKPWDLFVPTVFYVLGMIAE